MILCPPPPFSLSSCAPKNKGPLVTPLHHTNLDIPPRFHSSTSSRVVPKVPRISHSSNFRERRECRGAASSRNCGCTQMTPCSLCLSTCSLHVRSSRLACPSAHLIGFPHICTAHLLADNRNARVCVCTASRFICNDICVCRRKVPRS